MSNRRSLRVAWSSCVMVNVSVDFEMDGDLCALSNFLDGGANVTFGLGEKSSGGQVVDGGASPVSILRGVTVGR